MRNNGQTILSKFEGEENTNLVKGLVPYALSMITVDKTGKEIKVGVEKICEGIISRKNEITAKLNTLPTLIGCEPNCNLPEYWSKFNTTFTKIYNESHKELVSQSDVSETVVQEQQPIEVQTEVKNLMYQYNGLVYDYCHLLQDELQCNSLKNLGDNQKFKLTIEQCSLLGI